MKKNQTQITQKEDLAIAQAEILALEGHYAQAAQVFQQSNQADQAVQMFVDLRQWEKAKAIAADQGSPCSFFIFLITL